MADQIPLRLGAAKLGEGLQLSHAFDSFGNHVEPERITHRNDRAHE